MRSASAFSSVRGLATDECDPLNFLPTTATGCREENVATFLLLGALGRAMWGAIIGHFIRSEKWARVDDVARVSLVMPPRGIGAQITLGG